MKIYVGFVLFVSLLHSSAQLSYRAAVVEYTPELTTKANIHNYEHKIKLATDVKPGETPADIIVFPEGTLTTAKGNGSLVPDPKDGVIPYQDETYSQCQAVRAMSEAAARHEVYVVVNLRERVNCDNETKDCPERGFFLYNTNVAFDRQGRVVARYRKFNLYEESVDKPKTAELSTFTTDFGVTFGMIVCFDILFKAPSIDLVQKKNVTNIIFSTFWFGELPFLTAVQMQVGWSYAMNVTLLASGANRPEIGSTGSGIYRGRRRRMSWMSETKMDVLIMDRVPIDLSREESLEPGVRVEEPRGMNRRLYLKSDPSIVMSKGKNLDFAFGSFRDSICYKDLCCKFDMKYRRSNLENETNYTYRAVAFSDLRDFGLGHRHRASYCALLLCTNGNCAAKPPNGDFPLVFDDIQIEADFKKDNTFQMPSTLVWREDSSRYALLDALSYSEFSFERKEVENADVVNVSLKLKGKDADDIVSFAIFGREFD